ncbi:hypothetical protein THIBAULT_148 [Mycobacterium phage Thibault]|uniref:HNH nuclease domain-containing protein n=1 Tax=Mycobacterium phage Thibault TaxID=1052673 RepID=G1FGL3_9CAUD|nr:HNH endonuclease [Mycobacterium phage Thibault]AEJ94070.1 hypothetical protein THIBAULT_148 [Mycobacterium phage Thibault]
MSYACIRCETPLPRKRVTGQCRECFLKSSSTGKRCADCGRRCKRSEVRCPACRGAAPTRVCPDCGGKKTLRSFRCSGCHNRLVRAGERGKDHRAWKGGRVECKDGYVRIYMPDHPRAHNGRYVLEHIAVMERELGRYLHPDERVHHRNKVRNDNRPENLELWSVGHPAGARVEDLVTWAREVLTRYDS